MDKQYVAEFTHSRESGYESSKLAGNGAYAFSFMHWESLGTRPHVHVSATYINSLVPTGPPLLCITVNANGR